MAMRKMSAEHRKLAAMASAVAAMSGVGPALLRSAERQWYWAWIAMVVTLEIVLIVKLVRLRRTEGCV